MTTLLSRKILGLLPEFPSCPMTSRYPLPGMLQGGKLAVAQALVVKKSIYPMSVSWVLVVTIFPDDGEVLVPVALAMMSTSLGASSMMEMVLNVPAPEKFAVMVVEAPPTTFRHLKIWMFLLATVCVEPCCVQVSLCVVVTDETVLALD